MVTELFGENSTKQPKALTDEMLKNAQEVLGYKLPLSYIELLKTRNGGVPVRTCFSTSVKTSWVDNYIQISAIWGIGTDGDKLAERGIDAECGSQYMIEEWEYPQIGVMICPCMSAGPNAVFLDYGECGNYGEPKVVYIDVEDKDEPEIVFLAKDFETFINGLVKEEDIE